MPKLNVSEFTNVDSGTHLTPLDVSAQCGPILASKLYYNIYNYKSILILTICIKHIVYDNFETQRAT